VLDNYAYLVHAAGRQPALEPLLRSWMATYTSLVKVPILTAPSFDGTRDTSIEFQRAVDRTIDQLLDDYHLPRLVLPPTSREGWIPLVLSYAGLPSRPPQLELFGGARRSGPDRG
jgi:hypothetical protein